MIKQGSNEPIRFRVRKSTLQNAIHISFVVMDSSGILLSWNEKTVNISTQNNEVSAPITQAQTLALPVGPVQIKCKFMDKDSNIIFLRDVEDYVVKGDPTKLGVS